MALWSFGRKDPNTSLSPEVQRIFEKVHRFLDDEAAQNNALPEDIRRTLAKNPSCDRIPNAFGEFGRTPTNPIPVNGPVGELLYLSRLETSDGVAIAFHRLTALEEVDVFEVASEDGRHWDVLYLSLYFPRKSKHVPSGYRLTTDEARRRALIRGTTLRVDDFPQGIYSAAMECTKRLIGMPLGDSQLKAIEARNDLIRPRKHVEVLSKLVEFASQTATPPDPSRTKTAEPKARGSDKALDYARALALHIIEEMKADKTKEDIEPAERIVHLMALQMATAVHIAHAPEPRVVLRNFVEVLEEEVVKACRMLGKRC
jgi:hypothetical protein